MQHTLLEKGFGWKAEESSSEEEDYVDSDGESREDDEGHSQRDAMIEEEKQKCMRYLVSLKMEGDDVNERRKWRHRWRRDRRMMPPSIEWMRRDSNTLWWWLAP